MNLNESTLVLAENELGVDYFVGDIHGSIESFWRGLDSLNFDPDKDRVFSVGDLVDRGQSSMESLRLLHNPWFFAVAGNHERMLYEYLKGNPSKRSIENNWRYSLSIDEKHECLELMRLLSWIIEIKNTSGIVGVTHAYLPERANWNQFKAGLGSSDSEMIEHATWSRAFVSGEERNVEGVKWLFIGHQGLEEPMIKGNVVCIDTCVHILRRYGDSYGLTFSYVSEGAPRFHTIYNPK